jgi:class 3 adenylate cyclase
VDLLSKKTVAVYDLMPALVPHLAKWAPPIRPTADAYADDLVEYLRATVPAEAQLERNVEAGEVTVMLRIVWVGYVLNESAWLEIVPRLVGRDDYDRVVGRLEQMGVSSHQVVVMVVGDADDGLVERLRNRYLGRRSAFAVMRTVTVRRQLGPGTFQKDQVAEEIKSIVDAEVELYDRGTEIITADRFPSVSEIPFQDARRWVRVNDPICVFIDMRGSTSLSAREEDAMTAATYRFFTTTAVRILNRFGAAYIDVQGDGAFGLFDQSCSHAALAAAITANTFVREVFAPCVHGRTGLSVGAHIGIDRKSLLVRKIGLARRGGRTDRHNEVWAGRTVNMSAKLAALALDGELLVSDRFHHSLGADSTVWRCACAPQVATWTRRSVAQMAVFDFAEAMSSAQGWCPIHGREQCQALVALDTH